MAIKITVRESAHPGTVCLESDHPGNIFWETSLHTVLKLKTFGFAFIDIVLLIFVLNDKWRRSVNEKFDVADVCA